MKRTARLRPNRGLDRWARLVTSFYVWILQCLYYARRHLEAISGAGMSSLQLSLDKIRKGPARVGRVDP